MRRQNISSAWSAFYVSRFTLYVSLLALALAGIWSAPAAIDLSKIPPASTNRVEFLRDIKPILDASCLKCHGPEKPKSDFRVDSRAAILKGGANGIAVIPGNSAQSPFIHYVARLVEDMEMPPAGKGDPLTAAEISLLRAWIDQDVPWAGEIAAPRNHFEVVPTLRWIHVSGDERRFRENHWAREGWDGGLSRVELEQSLDDRSKVLLSARALRDDYRVTLGVEHRDGSFLRGGYEEWRRYYDDSGGHYANFTPPQFSLDRDLFVDSRRLWVEGGYVASFGTQFKIGYEYHSRDGDRAVTHWLPETQSGVTRNIRPNRKSIDETRHILRFDIAHEWETFRVSDSFRYEFTSLDNRQTHLALLQDNLNTTQRTRTRDRIDHLANALSFEKLFTDWLLVSGGYLYTHAEGDAAFDQRTVTVTGQPTAGSYWSGQGITLRQDAHVVNLNNQLGPWRGLTFTAGAQAEWNDQETFGPVSLDFVVPTDVPPRTVNPATVTGAYDRFITQERAGLRYTSIPFTVLYAETTLRQESIDQHDALIGVNDFTPGAFSREADICKDWRKYRAGFDVSPWKRVALNAWFQYSDRRTDWDQDVTSLFNLANIGPQDGYPGLLRSQKILTDELGARLVVRPNAWLKTTLAYRLVATDFRSRTAAVTNGGALSPGGRVHAGNYDAHQYSLNAVLTPWARLYLFTTLAFEDSRTVTADQGSAAIAPFKGKTYSAVLSGNYALNDATALSLTYSFSHADFEQNNAAAGLPLGLDYQWHTLRAGIGRDIAKRMRVGLDYFFSIYDEPTSGHLNDYTAHGVFASLNIRWQ